MPAPSIFCEHCQTFSPAERLDWNELTDERQWGGNDDLGMGMYHWKSEPLIRYYRRVRRCSHCDQLIRSAELDEAAVGELARLREEVQELRSQLERVTTHARSLAAELEL